MYTALYIIFQKQHIKYNHSVYKQDTQSLRELYLTQSDHQIPSCFHICLQMHVEKRWNSIALKFYFFHIKLLQYNLCNLLIYMIIIQIYTDNTICFSLLKQSNIFSSHAIIKGEIFRLLIRYNFVLQSQKTPAEICSRVNVFDDFTRFKICRKTELS